MLPSKIRTVQDFQKFLLRIFVLFFLLFFLLSNTYSQVCQSGAISVSGAGCGCLSGCNLTALGGPNCGSGTSGNCSGGTLPMSVTIIVPAGCPVKITAEMKTRPGCTASGADGNSTSADRLRIRNTAVAAPPWQIGGSNASLLDQMTIAGPATIVVEGAANRADEIITYTIEDVGGCTCGQILPITLFSFTGKAYSATANLLEWTTSSEINNDFFTLERSEDALNFEPIAIIKGAGNSNTIQNYSFLDNNFKQETTNPELLYYRLKQTDFDGQFEYFNTVAISRKESNEPSVYYYNKQLYIKAKVLKEGVALKIIDVTGRTVYETNTFNTIINLNQLAKGVYIYKLELNNTIVSNKFIVE